MALLCLRGVGLDAFLYKIEIKMCPLNPLDCRRQIFKNTNEMMMGEPGNVTFLYISVYNQSSYCVV